MENIENVKTLINTKIIFEHKITDPFGESFWIETGPVKSVQDDGRCITDGFDGYSCRISKSRLFDFDDVEELEKLIDNGFDISVDTDAGKFKFN